MPTNCGEMAKQMKSPQKLGKTQKKERKEKIVFLFVAICKKLKAYAR